MASVHGIGPCRRDSCGVLQSLAPILLRRPTRTTASCVSLVPCCANEDGEEVLEHQRPRTAALLLPGAASVEGKIFGCAVHVELVLRMNTCVCVYIYICDIHAYTGRARKSSLLNVLATE